ncbi:SLOG family protein [Reyranella sp.]|uniref:SLOG family protein n=1 Tax=Reyranella sp. TaxID=1929291 RepID=UPI001216C2A2|nr:SLOG family protein [Reyranella sp.]TAJ89686.1 MAG: DUF2493 domain-containing protein [Reyranella sp.]
MSDTPKFAETYCSQCGGSFGPGDSGFSHCDQHWSPGVRKAMARFDAGIAARRAREGYRVLATGSRLSVNSGPVDRVLGAYLEKHGLDLRLAAGGAPGIDTLVEEWALSMGVPFKRYAVDHNLDGPWPGAGPRRNQRMHDDFKPHEVAAFPGGKGTASMCRIAEQAGTLVTRVR